MLLELPCTILALDENVVRNYVDTGVLISH